MVVLFCEEPEFVAGVVGAVVVGATVLVDGGIDVVCAVAESTEFETVELGAFEETVVSTSEVSLVPEPEQAEIMTASASAVSNRADFTTSASTTRW